MESCEKGRDFALFLQGQQFRGVCADLGKWSIIWIRVSPREWKQNTARPCKR